MKPGEYPKCGPGLEDINVIRRLVSEGRPLDEIQRALSDIEPAAIEKWVKSLRPPEVKAKPRKTADPLE